MPCVSPISVYTLVILLAQIAVTGKVPLSPLLHSVWTPRLMQLCTNTVEDIMLLDFKNCSSSSSLFPLKAKAQDWMQLCLHG